MNPLLSCMLIGLAGFAVAEPPVSGYNYNRPSGGGGGGGSGYQVGGGGGGGYQQVSTGYQTSEGAQVDGALLEQIRQILLKEESQASQSGGGGGGGYPSGGSGGYPSSNYGPPSTSYGVPSQSYGVPSYQTRVVGVDLEGIRQAIQVAQFNQVSQGSSGGGYPSGYPSGPSVSYSPPSGSYGAPSRPPSGSYGAPF